MYPIKLHMKWGREYNSNYMTFGKSQGYRDSKTAAVDRGSEKGAGMKEEGTQDLGAEKLLRLVL